MAQDYHDLIVWKKAIALTICIYKLTQGFPRSELYGLTSQMRRASVSVASNIAEGRGRLNAAEFRQFLGIAQGSIFELRTQLLVAKSLEFTSSDSFRDADTLSNEVSKILRTFIQKLSIEALNNKTAAAILARQTTTLKANS
jgi:four helix bundle protein